ncbi:MAG: hypothetical protein J5645_04960 [Lachnospiraceae bacterium]|nr:hypothetical protein [Lachnospiraceae bacterium]
MKKFPIVVLSITLLLVLVSIVITFIGAFSGEEGVPLFKTGLFGIVFVPIFGWVMAASYNRVHKDDYVPGKPDESKPDESKPDESVADEAVSDEKEV